MRKGEHYIVTTNHGTRHPVGTEVVVLEITSKEVNPYPYYCRAVQGQTCYWYHEDELSKECDGIKVR